MDQASHAGALPPGKEGSPFPVTGPTHATLVGRKINPHWLHCLHSPHGQKHRFLKSSRQQILLLIIAKSWKPIYSKMSSIRDSYNHPSFLV